VCGDSHTGKKRRGGLFFTETGGFKYGCFNDGCEFYANYTGWEPGRPLGERELHVFESFGGCRADLPLIKNEPRDRWDDEAGPQSLAELIASAQSAIEAPLSDDALFEAYAEYGSRSTDKALFKAYSENKFGQFS
jgi:hypothetical protein